MTGTLINAAAILLGGGAGILLKSRIPGKYTEIIFQAIGLFTLFLGIFMAFKAHQFLYLIFSLLLGGITGEALKLDSRLSKITQNLQKRFAVGNHRFSEGLVTAFLLFCMGSMTILGAIEEGSGNFPNLLITKSIMDGFSAMALASALGIGVLFSAIPLLIYQGGITWLAYAFGNVIDPQLVDELTATGGVMLIGLGLTILSIKEIRVVNLLPGLIFAVLLPLLFG